MNGEFRIVNVEWTRVVSSGFAAFPDNLITGNCLEVITFPLGAIVIGACDEVLNHRVSAGLDLGRSALPVNLAVFHEDNAVGDTKDAP